MFKPRSSQHRGSRTWFSLASNHVENRLNALSLAPRLRYRERLTLPIDIISLGYVGLPLAVYLSRHFPVIGFDIDRQRVMPFGSPAQVKEEVHRTFEACGTADGGIIACGEIGPDVPLANVRAMYEAFRQYGRYA